MSDDPGKQEPLPPSEAASLLAPGLLHELRQPLLGLRAGVELAVRESAGAVESLEGFRVVQQQVERLSEMVRGFEELFTAPVVRRRRFDLAEVVERSVRLLRVNLRPLGDRFALLPAPPPLWCSGSPGAVAHALTNLLVNAIDAVSAADPAARVAVRVLAGSGGAREVRVSDEGGGIAPELVARLFSERFTTKGELGTGLGLQIARHAMRRTGGEVRLVATSDPARLDGARTEFCIEVAREP